MATTREAAVRVTAKTGGYQSGLRDMEQDTRRAGQRMGKGLSQPLRSGLSSAKSAMGDMLGGLKEGVKLAASLGGAFAVGDMVRRANDAEVQVLQLSGALSDFAKQTITAEQTQALLERAADKTRTGLDELRGSIGSLAAIAGQGGLEMVEESLARSTMQAKRLGVASEQVAEVHAMFLSKGVAKTAKEAEALTEQMVRFARETLGLNIEDALAINDIGEFAAFVNSTGDGVAEMTSLLGRTGETAKDLGQALEIIEELGLVLNTRGGLEKLRKEAKLTSDQVNLGKSSIENMFTALEQGGPEAFKKIQDQLATDRARKAFEEILGTDLVVKLDEGKLDRGEFDERVAELKRGVEGAAKASMDLSAAEEQNKRLLETRSARLQDALNKIELAFQKPEVAEALEQLAEVLPQLAKVIANVVSMVAKNPAMAVGGVVAAKAAGSFVSGALGTQGQGSGAAVAAAIKGAFKVGSAEFAAKAATSGKWAAAGTTMAKVAGPAIAGLIAFEVGRRAIDKALKEEEKTVSVGDDLNRAAADALGGRDPEKIRAALAAAKAKRRELQKGPGDVTAVIGGFAKDVSALFGVEVQGPVERTVKAFEETDQIVRELEAKLRRVGGSSDGAGRANRRLAADATAAANALRKIKSAAGGGEGAERGPKQPGAPRPGAAPMRQGG